MGGSLDLDNNRLTALPESLEQLKDLKQLFLHGNPGLGLVTGHPWSDLAGGSA